MPSATRPVPIHEAIHVDPPRLPPPPGEALHLAPLYLPPVALYPAPLAEHGPDEAALLLLEEDPDYDGSEAGTRPLPLREPAWREVAADLAALCGAGGGELLQEETNPGHKSLCCKREEVARHMEQGAGAVEAVDPDLARDMRGNARWLREEASADEVEAVALVYLSSIDVNLHAPPTDQAVDIDVSDLSYLSLPVEKGGLP